MKAAHQRNGGKGRDDVGDKFSLSYPVASVVGEKSYVNIARIRQSVLMLSLRRYELAEGKLPDSLQALVPKYLAAVPLDPFDNAPMRWNSDTQVVYSIGPDLNDDGGSITPELKSTDKDIGDIYWWKPDEQKPTK